MDGTVCDGCPKWNNGPKALADYPGESADGYENLPVRRAGHRCSTGIREDRSPSKPILMRDDCHLYATDPIAPLTLDVRQNLNRCDLEAWILPSPTPLPWQGL